jgi:hypothetical protein
MALGSTRPMTEMNTRNLPGDKGRPTGKASQPYRFSTTCYRDTFTFFTYPVSLNDGTVSHLQPKCRGITLTPTLRIKRKYEDYCLMESPSTLKTKAACSSETSVNILQPIYSYIPDDRNLTSNLRSKSTT